MSCSSIAILSPRCLPLLLCILLFARSTPVSLAVSLPPESIFVGGMFDGVSNCSSRTDIALLDMHNLDRHWESLPLLPNDFGQTTDDLKAMYIDHHDHIFAGGIGFLFMHSIGSALSSWESIPLPPSVKGSPSSPNTKNPHISSIASVPRSLYDDDDEEEGRDPSTSFHFVVAFSFTTDEIIPPPYKDSDFEAIWFLTIPSMEWVPLNSTLQRADSVEYHNVGDSSLIVVAGQKDGLGVLSDYSLDSGMWQYHSVPSSRNCYDFTVYDPSLLRYVCCGNEDGKQYIYSSSSTFNNFSRVSDEDYYCRGALELSNANPSMPASLFAISSQKYAIERIDAVSASSSVVFANSKLMRLAVDYSATTLAIIGEMRVVDLDKKSKIMTSANNFVIGDLTTSPIEYTAEDCGLMSQFACPFPQLTESSRFIGASCGRLYAGGKCLRGMALLEGGGEEGKSFEDWTALGNLVALDVPLSIHTVVFDASRGVYFGGSFQSLIESKQSSMAFYSSEKESWIPFGSVYYSQAGMSGVVYSLQFVNGELIGFGDFSILSPYLGGPTDEDGGSSWSAMDAPGAFWFDPVIQEFAPIVSNRSNLSPITSKYGDYRVSIPYRKDPRFPPSSSCPFFPFNDDRILLIVGGSQGFLDLFDVRSKGWVSEGLESDGSEYRSIFGNLSESNVIESLVVTPNSGDFYVGGQLTSIGTLTFSIGIARFCPCGCGSGGGGYPEWREVLPRSGGRSGGSVRTMILREMTTLVLGGEFWFEIPNEGRNETNLAQVNLENRKWFVFPLWSSQFNSSSPESEQTWGVNSLHLLHDHNSSLLVGHDYWSVRSSLLLWKGEGEEEGGEWKEFLSSCFGGGVNVIAQNNTIQCGSYASCLECLGNENCGWCDSEGGGRSRCVGGNGRGPLPGTCSSFYRYNCPRSSSKSPLLWPFLVGGGVGVLILAGGVCACLGLVVVVVFSLLFALGGGIGMFAKLRERGGRKGPRGISSREFAYEPLNTSPRESGGSGGEIEGSEDGLDVVFNEEKKKRYGKGGVPGLIVSEPLPSFSPNPKAGNGSVPRSSTIAVEYASGHDLGWSINDDGGGVGVGVGSHSRSHAHSHSRSSRARPSEDGEYPLPGPGGSSRQSQVRHSQSTRHHHHHHHHHHHQRRGGGGGTLRHFDTSGKIPRRSASWANTPMEIESPSLSPSPAQGSRKNSSEGGGGSLSHSHSSLGFHEDEETDIVGVTFK